MVPASEPIMVSMAAIQASLNLSLERMKLSEERTYTPWVQATAAHKWADDAATAVAVLPSAGLTSATTARCSPSVADVLAVRAGFPTTMPTSCSTYVLTSPPEGSTAGACAVNTDPPRSTSFPCFDGTNPRLWRAKCLQYFTHFNIHQSMWVVAARIHMDGKAKEWFEAYRLRQVVGAWPEFINDVEAHFGVGDPPSSTPILGVSSPSVVVQASGNISPAPPTRCLTVSPKEVLATAAEPTEPLFPELDIDSANKEFEDEVLIIVGGVSLFLELDMYSDVEVLTHIGGSSLFLEQIIDTRHELEEKVDKPTPWEHGLGRVGLVFPLLPSDEGMLLQLLLREMQLNGKINATLGLPWDRGKHEFLLQYLGWQLTNVGKGTMPTLLCEQASLQWSRTMQQCSRKRVTMVVDIKVSFINFLLGVNIWEDIKSRVLAFELRFQWDPGIVQNALMDAMFGIGQLSSFLRGMIFSDQEKLSDVQETARACHSPGVLCPQLTRTLKFGLSVFLEDAIDTLGVRLSCTLVNSNQQSKLNCAKSDFLMLPRKKLQLPWDPGGIHKRRILSIAWGQAMFCRGGSVTPGVHSVLGLACWVVHGLGPAGQHGSGRIKGKRETRKRTSKKR